jgi:hypothetical protein
LKTAERLVAETDEDRRREQAIRESERMFWVGVFSRQADGRSNAHVAPEVRRVYRMAAAQMLQDRSDG